MRSITLKLILSFLVISLIAIGLMAFFSRQAVVSRFDTLLFNQAKTNFSERILEYYEASGSLEGVAQNVVENRDTDAIPAPQNNPIPCVSIFGSKDDGPIANLAEDLIAGFTFDHCEGLCNCTICIRD